MKHQSKAKKTLNPALAKAKIEAEIKANLDSAHKRGVEFSTMCVKLFSYMVLSDKFGFSTKDLEKFRKALDNLGDSMCKDYVTIEDILGVCMNDLEIKFTFDELRTLDPNFNIFDEVSTPVDKKEEELP